MKTVELRRRWQKLVRRVDRWNGPDDAPVPNHHPCTDQIWRSATEARSCEKTAVTGQCSQEAAEGISAGCVDNVWFGVVRASAAGIHEADAAHGSAKTDVHARLALHSETKHM
ncbi:hypothetical protein EVG20_g3967 [Dentipellis fragilis]|uniref:Uncharacterized protein n=1 Tax=Dentipellis fragilis TaxID=205917 RepID=A0A4Y9Z0I9_9AGAM|nr:hypothetical protein EVG20_g3967 [Dentipellis fragilis]